MIVLSVLLSVLGVAVLVTGVLAVTGKLPGNRWVGLRIPEVRKNREMWDTGHRIAGPTWAGAGVALIAAGVVSLQGGWLWAVTALLVVGALFLIGVGAALAAQTLAKIDHAKAQQAEQTRAAAGCCSSGKKDSADSADGAETSGGCGDGCGNGCGGGCGGHDSAPSVPVELDLDAARRAVASRDDS
ncbi:MULTISPECIES: SdpI family protein [unclassified Corynebacterium]|uniref:SdpI family protein n=1 Tax=unclassified Corynebacterium TaxID=2624378 RepID=UPI002647CBD2|nr:SdpI family protein [Corynebacterium sp.]MDN5582349.1 SdpI family protein [Corynebacterium sp.]MDN5720010.1 SdpI family protein [Corynebacterium sp.]MDN6258561.1 SdpI family protein [Corynebacterium sp.]MDN6324202.1 SdpI family protein [Corynebacterium sp.]MDN6509891.1 SdpI family protein [Corynebacterium sp.]